jgi:RecA/RadA recombinase
MAKNNSPQDDKLQQRIAERRKIVEARQKKFNIPKSSLLVGGEHEKYEFVPIGIPEIDAKLKTTSINGVESAGLLRGTIIELCGPSMSGKTYATYHLAKEHQKLGLRVLFVDVERGYYEPRALQLGVNIEDPDLWELQKVTFAAGTVGDYVVDCVNSGDYGLIIVDSITTLIPDADFDKSLEDNAKVGAHAMFMGQFMRKLVASKMEENLTTVVLINQLRTGSGAMPNSFTDKSTGGKAVEYWSRIRLWFSRINGKDGWVIDGKGNKVGGRSRCTIYKTKTGGQDEVADFPVYFVPADNDIVGEFLHRVVSNKDFEGIVAHSAGRGGREKLFRYTDEETGELIATPDKYEFCIAMMSASPPTKRPKTDKSETMFEYMCKRLKLQEEKIVELQERIKNPPADELTLSELAPDES